MSADDKLTLFYVPPRLRELAAERSRAALDVPTDCFHLGAFIVCANHPGEGVLCLDCSTRHFVELLDDPRCVVCRIREARGGLMQLPSGEYDVLARLCAGCLA